MRRGETKTQAEDDTKEDEDLRPKQITNIAGMPQDNDSVSTLGALFTPKKTKQGNTPSH